MRGKVEIETVRKEREAIIITEIPYQVNKASMVERIAELVRDKKIDGVADLRDESDRDGYRVVIELKREAEPDVVLNQLYRFTPLQSSFGANMVALDGGRPLVMTLKDLLTIFIAFREEVVSRRTKYLLGKARDRAHVLVGLAIAVANIDEMIKLIRGRQGPERGARGLDGARLGGQGCGRDGDADRRPAPQGYAQRHDQAFRRTGQGNPRPAPATADRAWPRRDQGRARQACDRNRRLSRHPALARTHSNDHQGRACGGEEGIRHAAPHRDRGSDRRCGRRRPDHARGHGRHRLASGLHQARAALDLSRAATRRQRPRRHAGARRGFRVAAVRRLHPRAGAVSSRRAARSTRRRSGGCRSRRRRRAARR